MDAIYVFDFGWNSDVDSFIMRNKIDRSYKGFGEVPLSIAVDFLPQRGNMSIETKGRKKNRPLLPRAARLRGAGEGGNIDPLIIPINKSPR